MKTLLLVLVITAVALVGCGKHSTNVSLAEATATLDTAVSYAQAHDLIGLGTLADNLLMAVRIWGTSGEWNTLPQDPPTVVDNYPLNSKLGGRVLVLEGIDGLGKPYRTEFLVYWYNGQLTVGNVIYWDGMGLGH
jgi:hypothetical protein